MRLFSDHPEEERARIELIPMIDIMFFLLVVFIFISISLIKLNGVTLNLPKAATQPIKKEIKTLNISITENGALYLDKTPVTKDQLKSDLAAIAKDPSVKEQIIISGDKDSHLQALVSVMNLCNTLGFDNLSIRTQKQ